MSALSPEPLSPEPLSPEPQYTSRQRSSATRANRSTEGRRRSARSVRSPGHLIGARRYALTLARIFDVPAKALVIRVRVLSAASRTRLFSGSTSAFVDGKLCSFKSSNDLLNLIVDPPQVRGPYERKIGHSTLAENSVSAKPKQNLQPSIQLQRRSARRRFQTPETHAVLSRSG